MLCNSSGTAQAKNNQDSDGDHGDESSQDADDDESVLLSLVFTGFWWSYLPFVTRPYRIVEH